MSHPSSIDIYHHIPLKCHEMSLRPPLSIHFANVIETSWNQFSREKQLGIVIVKALLFMTVSQPLPLAICRQTAQFVQKQAIKRVWLARQVSQDLQFQNSIGIVEFVEFIKCVPMEFWICSDGFFIGQFAVWIYRFVWIYGARKSMRYTLFPDTSIFHWICLDLFYSYFMYVYFVLATSESNPTTVDIGYSLVF